MYLYKEKAAWTYDGTVDFYLDKVSDASWGSSMNQKHRDVQNGKNKVTVKCVDLARLINQYNETDLIVVKMDIEGAEYDLLKDFQKKDTFKLIDFIAVEFHDFVSPYPKAESDFVQMINETGMKFVKWN